MTGPKWNNSPHISHPITHAYIPNQKIYTTVGYKPLPRVNTWSVDYASSNKIITSQEILHAQEKHLRAMSHTRPKFHMSRPSTRSDFIFRNKLAARIANASSAQKIIDDNNQILLSKMLAIDSKRGELYKTMFKNEMTSRPKTTTPNSSRPKTLQDLSKGGRDPSGLTYLQRREIELENKRLRRNIESMKPSVSVDQLLSDYRKHEQFRKNLERNKHLVIPNLPLPEKS